MDKLELYSPILYIDECLLDVERTEAFGKAIERTVKKGDTVLDAGTGSGILALMATRAGAKKVYAVEANQESALLAQKSFAAMDSRIAVYGLLVLVGITGALGDIAVNQWAKSWQFNWWLVSCAIWIITATIFGVILHKGYFNFGVAVVLALLVHSGLVLLWDALWEKAHLSSLQWLGVIFALLAFCFLEVGKMKEVTGQ